MSTRLHIVMSDGLVERIDRVRGDVPRSVWLRRVVERELARLFDGVLDGILDPSSGSVEGAVERALSEPWDPEVRQSGPAAPAEQLEDRLRTAVKHFEPDLRELAAEAPVEKPRLFRCPACDFSAPSPKVTCARHGYRLR